MLENYIKVDMPVFLYQDGQDEGISKKVCIKGNLSFEGGRPEFQGFIGIDDELYDIKSIDFKSNGGNDPVMILAGYNKKGDEIVRGVAAYLDKDLKFIKGTLYRFDDMEVSPLEFAAPAETMAEAEIILNKIKPRCTGLGIVGGRDFI